MLIDSNIKSSNIYSAGKTILKYFIEIIYTKA